MSDDQQQTPVRGGRRSSFAGQTFADLFGSSRPSVPKAPESNSPPPTQQMPGPISQAAAQAQRRRMSLTTIGLSGSPTQTSPFGSYRGRRDSIGSANSGSIDESAIAEDDTAARDTSNGSAPATPFARRTSFGARALRDIRTASFGGGGGGPGSPGQNGRSPPPAASSGAANRASQTGTASSRDAKGRGLSLATPCLHGSASHARALAYDRDTLLTSYCAAGSSSEGFNWSDNFHSRAQRTSIAGPSGGGPPVAAAHGRAKSVAVMEPPPVAQMPKPKEQKRPDAFQERILKGDFYMD